MRKDDSGEGRCAGDDGPEAVLAALDPELRSRLRQLDGPGGAGLDQVTARTFHSAALRQLVHFWPATVGGRPPAVLDSKIGLLAEAARAARVPATGPELRDLATEVEWAKVMQVRPEDYAGAAAGHGRTPPVDHEAAGRVFAAYERLRRDRHLADFESVLELTAAILAGHPAAGAELRDRYRYFVVDEFQDVNPLQKLLLHTWAGDRDDVCVVGDPRQTIYSFTGATSGYLTGFAAEYPHATVVRLVRNYRSTPEVVDCANRLARARGGRGGWAGPGPGDAGTGLDGGPPLVAQRAGGGAARDRWESLAALAQLAEDHCAASPGAGLPGIAAELARRAAAERAPQVEGVTVASLHAAKGLEWDVVFLPGLTEGNLPIVHAEGDEAVAEERRLLYVGVTRARQQVLLSWPLARLPGG